jgi:hypothetical protein
MPSTPASDVTRVGLRRSMPPAAGDVPPSLSLESKLDLGLVRNTDTLINVRTVPDGKTADSSTVGAQSPVAARLRVVRGVDTIDRDDQDSAATSSDTGSCAGSSTWAPPAPTAPGKIAAAARARALASQAAEPRMAGAARLPLTEPVPDMPENQYSSASNARLSIPFSLADTAPPLYSERPT